MNKILICAPVRQDDETFKIYLEHLRNQIIPEDVSIEKLFVFHNCEHLQELLDSTRGETCYIFNDKSEYKKDNNTHNWDLENFNAVIYFKNMMLKYAYENNYDYIFLVDSDLILHHYTLHSLYTANKDMVVEVFWTKWQQGIKEMPNAWSFDHYSFHKQDLEQWGSKGLYRVGMAGACTLLSRKVFSNSNINFSPLYNVSFTHWEDRAFCIRCAVNDIEIWLDTNYPAIHLYRKEELEKFKRGELKHE